MRLPRPANRKQRDNTVALINIVFLMLIFFLIAGTLATPLDPDLKLIETAAAEATPPPDALVATQQGDLKFHNRMTTAADHLASLKPGADGSGATVELAADRDLPAAKLIDIVTELRAAGADSISVVTQRAPQ